MSHFVSHQILFQGLLLNIIYQLTEQGYSVFTGSREWRGERVSTIICDMLLCSFTCLLQQVRASYLDVSTSTS